MNRKIKWISFIIGGLLLFMAIASFVIAVGKGFNDPVNESQEIRVIINDNDSIVEQLKNDINHLTRQIEQMESDSIVVTININRTSK